MNQILFLSCFADVFGCSFINSLPVKLLRLSFVCCLLLLGSCIIQLPSGMANCDFSNFYSNLNRYKDTSTQPVSSALTSHTNPASDPEILPNLVL